MRSQRGKLLISQERELMGGTTPPIDEEMERELMGREEVERSSGTR